VLLAAAAIALATAVPADAHKRRGHGHHAHPRGALPIVIGHRGASAYRPEHTLASYQLAIDMGADYIEPDLVSTKDGVLVARHENNIAGTTDVASHPEFADRKKTKTIDGVSMEGWFTEDFTLAELKTLRAVERLPVRRPFNTAFNGMFEIPTFQQVIELAKREGVGIYPETKHPTYFDSIGLSLEEPLVAALNANGLNRRGAPVFIQSFETGNLKELESKVRVPLIQLIDATGGPFDLRAQNVKYDDLVTPAGLDAIARYADGVGVERTRVIPRDATQHYTTPTTLVRDAHRRGLDVHVWTFRPENEFLSADFQVGTAPTDPAARERWLSARGNQPAEFKLFFGQDIDGLFADNPDTAVAVRTKVFRR
jgi:glycerophosphoryl diester phosphodiesterase